MLPSVVVLMKIWIVWTIKQRGEQSQGQGVKGWRDDDLHVMCVVTAHRAQAPGDNTTPCLRSIVTLLISRFEIHPPSPSPLTFTTHLECTDD